MGGVSPLIINGEDMEENKVAEIEPKLGDTIPESWLKEAESIVKQGYKPIRVKEFRGKDETELYIHNLNAGVEGLATDAYGRVFNRLIKEPDYMTKNQLEDVLKSKNIWGEKEEKLIEQYKEEMREIEFQVAKMRQKGKYNKDSMIRLRESWTKHRGLVNELLSKKSSLLSNSVESRAEEEEVKVKLSHCVKYPDGTRVWNSIEELNQETDRLNLVKLLSEAIYFWSGLTQEIINDLPVKILFGGEEEKSEN